MAKANLLSPHIVSIHTGNVVFIGRSTAVYLLNMLQSKILSAIGSSLW